MPVPKHTFFFLKVVTGFWESVDCEYRRRKIDYYKSRALTGTVANIPTKELELIVYSPFSGRCGLSRNSSMVLQLAVSITAYRSTECGSAGSREAIGWSQRESRVCMPHISSRQRRS